MEDLFDNTRDKWQKSFRYPLYQRFLWLVGAGILVAGWVARHRLRGIIASDPRVGWAAAAGVAALAVWCFWVSFRGWQSRVLISPTSLKAWYLFQGRERISWDHMHQVVYKWRLLGHTLIFLGTDGARVKFRSSIRGYDQIVEFIRANAPQHIVEQLDGYLFEEEELEEESEEAEPPDDRAEQPRDDERREDADEEDNDSTPT